MSDSKSTNSEYVFRPLGLTIGIMAAFVLFGFWQLIKFYIAYRLNANEPDFVIGGFPYDLWTKAGGIAGALIIVSSVFAWLGKPPSMRWVFQVLVLISGLLLIGEILYRAYGDSSSPFGNSADNIASDTAQCLVPTYIGTLVYVLWFMNRAPARAFYTQTPMEAWEETKTTDGQDIQTETVT